MSRWGAALRLGCVLLLVGAGVGAPAAASPAGCEPHPRCVGGSDGGFTGIGLQGVPGGGGTVGVPGGGGGPAALPTTEVQRRIAPTCSGNSPYQDGNLCLAALSGCPVKGEVAFWVWLRTVSLVGPPGDPPWVRVTDPPYACFGPGSPAVPPAAAIAGLVQRDFGRYPLPRPVLRTEPGGRTLVRFVTNLYTATPAEDAFTVTLLGLPVRIWAHAEHWTWHFGDGAALTTDTPGRAGSTDVSHTYLRPGTVAPYVVTEWSGTYQVAGSSAVLPVQGTATTVGPSAGLRVEQARSQYVTG